ncbi:MAG: DUF3301 domain-containing protein [Gammaproteobacteria bacterium]|nr:DUF3301 domain-containing protein [Gammaproteobacteria bacterium]MCI0591157.1 DUF3301 domain-containing protein [Gammaproteobacteria bacterium]
MAIIEPQPYVDDTRYTLRLMNPLVAIIAIGALAWFWVDSLRAREKALKSCAAACRQMDVQFLDQTVALCQLGLGRTARGQIKMRRRYMFEFSTDGINRHKGSTALLGSTVEYIRLDHPDGSTIVQLEKG